VKALVTGGFGFAGRHLATHLVKCGDDVALTYLPKVEDVAGEVGVSVPKVVQTIALDVCDKKAVDSVISLMRPDVIYHLAAITYVPEAQNDPSKTLEVNLTGTENILDAVAKHSPETRILFVGSSNSYGEPRPGSLPQTELSELRPSDIYSLSKTYADLACYCASVSRGVDVVRIRPFQHTGPGQSERFALSSFAKQVAEIKLGRREKEVLVGNLEVKRDYSDVSDIVRGYREAALNGKTNEVYNLCSGESVALESYLKLLIERSGEEIEIKVDPARVREVDVPDVYGSYARASKDFGWSPRVTREAMIDTLLASWVETLS
jgi:GDP-4-dehydro-6-deoxy-D-mannose reductase